MVIGIAVVRIAEGKKHTVCKTRFLRMRTVSHRQDFVMRNKVLPHCGEPAASEFAFKKRIYAIAKPHPATTTYCNRVPFNLVDAFLIFQQVDASFTNNGTGDSRSKLNGFSGDRRIRNWEPCSRGLFEKGLQFFSRESIGWRGIWRKHNRIIRAAVLRKHGGKSTATQQKHRHAAKKHNSYLVV